MGNAPTDRRRLVTLAIGVLVAGDLIASTATTAGTRRGGSGLAGARAAGTARSLAVVRNMHRNAAGCRDRSGNITGIAGALTDTAAMVCRFTVLPRVSTTDEPPSGGVRDGGVLQLASWWLSAWYADPCENFDAAVNGFWKLVNPPHRLIPSRLRELDEALQDQLLHTLSLLPSAPAPSPAGRLLADIWASAFRPESRSWTVFAPQGAAITALSTRSDVEAHFCNGLGEGRDSIIEFRSGAGIAELDLDVALLPPPEREVYTAAADDPRVTVHLERVQALLTSAGMPASEAGVSAPVLLQMESRLAASSDELREVDLDSAQRAVPDFPWRETWNALGLDAGQKVYAGLERCRVLGMLLQDHDVSEWKAWLLYQEARHARPFIEYSSHPGQVLRMLDRRDLAQQVLSGWFMEGIRPGPAQRAQAMFEQIRHQFRQDVESSKLPAADKQRVIDALVATQLQLGGHAHGVPSTSQPTKASFLQHIQALRCAFVQRGVRQLGGVAAAPALPAHRFFMAYGVGYDKVFASPALVASLLDQAAGSAEIEWATLGVMLGHELGHALANVEHLSAQGVAIMAQLDEQIAQRINDIRVAGRGLDVSRVLAEVACDFRGLSTARRAGRAEALAAGVRFDDRCFFTEVARLHAANPTSAQLRKALAEDDHPPPQVRVALLQQAEGFEAAFDCPPTTSAAFDAVV